MNRFKSTLAVAGAGMLMAAGTASAVTIDNLNFPTSQGEHVFAGTVNENLALNVGNELTGYGQVNTVDDKTNFCGTGSCQLTYTFSGYKVEEITSTTANFSGGQANFYTSDGGYDGTAATASQGKLFLSLSADPEPNSTFTLEGSLTNPDLNQAQNTAVGLLSVTGGSGASIFDNNSYDNGNGGLSDLLFNTSLSPTGVLTFGGSADGHYIRPKPVVEAPEPSELAMLGLGVALIGFGVYRRRRGDTA